MASTGARVLEFNVANSRFSRSLFNRAHSIISNVLKFPSMSIEMIKRFIPERKPLHHWREPRNSKHAKY